VPSASQRTADAAFAASFDPFFDRLDAVMRAQRKLQQRHAGSLVELSATVKTVADGQQSITDRLSEMEVFLVRFDGVIGDFSQRLDALAKQHVHPVKGHLLWLAAAVGMIIGVAISAGMRL
jgi:hypothetical protein